MGELLRADPRPPLLQPLLLLLAGGVSLGVYAAGSDEPGPEGLTSTSLMDLLLPTGLERLDSEEPSEAMGLGAGLGAPGSGFSSEDSEESRILQPPQYFWEEEEELNASNLDLGPTADYGFPDLTEKTGPIEDTSQGQEVSSLPLPLSKMNLVEPPWHIAPGEEDIEKEEEEEEKEELLPVNRAQEEAQTQVVCKDWSNLAGKNYIILNMTKNIDCEVFRQHWGLQLLALVEEVLPRHGSGQHGDWHISLSKPSEKEQHLLMTLVGEQGVVPTKDVLSILGDIRRSLVEIGIQNYSTTSSCQARASQVRSDYGTLFVVLVVIGAICVIIIVLGLLYNCWQRRLPKLKHVSHGEELRFVENGCHDNPTLDVASDSQSEMQEKQPSLNGGGALNGPGGWSVLLGGKRDPEDSDVFEEDTHL
uniref:Podocalyxin like 2 n=1 Tax=Molossus molossus TaxID=27622 RepID=A0A7J8HJT5_MOLMO|nr:podocalyxin like 2 [Molossus molossus]